MEQSLGLAKMIERMKEELFSPSANLFTLLPVSAYETAWVTMVPDPDDPTSPIFPEYLDWILRSQNALGFWFDEQHGINNDHHELIDYKSQCSNDDLLATLACLIALKTWEINGFSHRINKGQRFLRDNMDKELMNMRKREERGDKVGNAQFRRWVLMAELALVEDMIEKERLVMRDIAFENYGSTLLLRSPSVTACAYMITGDWTYKSYLQRLLTNCQHGVPPMFSMDKDFMMLCVVDHLERLGCAEHFSEEIKHTMDHLYGKWIEEESKVSKKDDDVFQIYNDSLAFRLLRMHGYPVSPRRFCWFIDDEKMLSHMKDNYAFFLGPMLSIYKASHIAFLEDHDLDKAGVFSMHILQKGLMSMKSQNETNISYSSKKFEQEIEHELELTWLARMDHLEHRLYIERGGIYNFWVGKNAPYRILQNNDLLQLAIDSFMMRQSTYRKELHELQRWSKDTGLSMMGFGREKTTYCYFAMASSSCLPLDIDSRKEATKCAILIQLQMISLMRKAQCMNYPS
ncbi:S-linalool synthase-like [Dendrobium catenatum]|uniref:S-linalool synthase-like n=1 Tax=Dendrobium catenatum TaxID=906689 RepID=UPI00109FE5FC|nr:S-linalool synthase-like [Dendrobium catenatum]